MAVTHSFGRVEDLSLTGLGKHEAQPGLILGAALGVEGCS